MKSAKPSTGTSKRSWGEAFTKTPTSSAMPAVEDTFVDPTIAVGPFSASDDVDPIVAPSLSLRAKMESFMTT